jgi:ribosomal protein S18 acetylase RimI-like enzyme
VRKPYRRQGLGRQLAATIIDQAKHYLPQLKIITLHVFARNAPARALYRQLGFKEYGYLPQGKINADDTTEDGALMYKNL